MSTPTKTKTDNWLIVEGVPGLTIAPGATPLTRLNYFDGKFLRAKDLKLEQDGQRRLVQLSNIAGGYGLVHGFDTALGDDDLLSVGAGEAIDAAGHVLLLPMTIEVSITELIERSKQLAKPAFKSLDEGEAYFEDCQPAAVGEPGLVDENAELWLITVAHAEFLCGEEEVYGKLCEEACVSSTDRPYRIEGVVLRARPLALDSPYPSSGAVALGAKHLRSRVASAYFADERGRPSSLISGAGLRSKIWCLGAELSQGEVALGVLCRQGAANRWFDAWTARRERMESPPRAYWAHRMAMRPWREYLAQILQFQCQLAGLLCDIATGGGSPTDPCAETEATLGEARDTVEKLLATWAEVGIDQLGELGAASVETLEALRAKLAAADDGDDGDTNGGAALGEQVLIDGGIVELPPAGYLPVDPNSELSVDEQVRRLLGQGVDLRFCVIRPDDAARELEGAQHMDRISLLRGLDDPSNKDPVDILVPDGQLIVREDQSEGLSFRAKIGMGTVEDLQALTQIGSPLSGAAAEFFAYLAKHASMHLRGAARAARRSGGGAVFYCAAVLQPKYLVGINLKALSYAAAVPAYASYGDAPATEAESFGEYAKKKLVKAYELKAKQPAAAINDNVGMVEIEHNDQFEPKPKTPSSLAVWCDLSIDADPFAKALHTPIAFVVDVQVSIAGDPGRYRLSGDVSVSKRASFPGGELLAAKITGFERVFGGDTDTNTPASFNAKVYRLETGPDQGKIMVTLNPLEAKLDHDLVLAWDGQSLEVTGASFHDVEPENPENELFFELHNLVGDEAVREPNDPDHLAALQGVQMVANAAAEPGFAAEAANKLFPPEDASVNYEVQALRDWVLFHARHEKRCVGEGPIKPVEPGRVYRIYTLDFDNFDELSSVAQELEANSGGLVEYEFEEVGLAEYAPGVSALRTSSDALTALWTPYGEGEELAWVGIASQGPAAAEGEAVAEGRALALEQIVEQVSPALPKQATKVLGQIPDVLEAEDGVIVLLTLRGQAQATTCHEVYWISTAVHNKTNAEMLARAGQWDALLSGFTNQNGGWDWARELSIVEFDGVNMSSSAADFAAKWAGVSDDCPASVQIFSVYSGSADNAGDASTRSQQRAALGGALNVTPADADDTALDSLPGDCPIRTFIYPKLNNLFLARITPSPNTEGQLEEYLAAGDIDGLLQSALAPFNFGDLACNFNSDIAAWASLNSVEDGEVWDRVVAFTRSGDADLPDEATIRTQIKRGLTLINAPSGLPIELRQTEQDWTMGGGDVMVLVIRSFG